jgi:hypothetical protein
MHAATAASRVTGLTSASDTILICRSQPTAASPSRAVALRVRQEQPQGAASPATVAIVYAVRIVNALPLAATVAVASGAPVYVPPMSCSGVLAPLPATLVRVRVTLEGSKPSVPVIAAAGQPGWLQCERAADGAMHNVAVHITRSSASCTIVLHADAWLYSLMHVPLHVVLCSRRKLSDTEGLKEVLLSTASVAGTPHESNMNACMSMADLDQHRKLCRSRRSMEEGLCNLPANVDATVVGVMQQRVSAAGTELVAACTLPACAGMVRVFDDRGAHCESLTDVLPVLMAAPPTVMEADAEAGLAVHISAQSGLSDSLLEDSAEAFEGLLEACIPLDPEEEWSKEVQEERVALKLQPAAVLPLSATVTRQRLPLMQQWLEHSGLPRPGPPVPLPVAGLAAPDEATRALLARLACTAVAVAPARVVHNALPLCTLTLEQPEDGVYKPSGRQVLAEGCSAALLCTPSATVPPVDVVPIRITVPDCGHLRTASTTLTTSNRQPVTLTTTSAPPEYALIATRTTHVPLPPLPMGCQSPFPVSILHTSITSFDPESSPAHVQNLTMHDVRVFQQRDEVHPSSALAAASVHPRDSLHNVFQDVPAYQRRPFLFSGGRRCGGSGAGVLRMHFAVGLLIKINSACKGGWPVSVADWLGGKDRVGCARELGHLGSCKIVTDGAMAEDAQVCLGLLFHFR